MLGLEDSNSDKMPFYLSRDSSPTSSVLNVLEKAAHYRNLISLSAIAGRFKLFYYAFHITASYAILACFMVNASASCRVFSTDKQSSCFLS